MVMALTATLLFVMGSPAFGQTPQLGDPVGANVSPHGGYDSTTDFCVQCHSVHAESAGAGAYALLYADTVTATCNTCHGLPAYGGAASGRRDSNAVTGFTGGTMGTASSRTAYDSTTAAATHPLYSTSTDGTGDDVNMQTSGWGYHGDPAAWAAADEQTNDGLQCTSCHTSHGDFGALINSENGVIRTTAVDNDITDVDVWQDGAPIYRSATLKYLNLGGDGVWEACSDEAGTTGCADLTTTDSEGQTVYLYGYKLLSAYPNYNWDGGGESWGVDYRNHDQARWCGSCHPNKVATEYGGTYHNHPTGCTACHGNPSNDATSKDFPHTSSFDNFLLSYPDGLCVGSCHTAGSLP
jgi:nitrate/TMAO reductase-like tetraheme cytochrome c subunit